MWFYSDVDISESFWGSNFPNNNPANSDDCGVFVVDFDKYWWEDTSCLAQEAHEHTVAVICQKDIGAEFSTTTSWPGTTTAIGTTTVGTTTAWTGGTYTTTGGYFSTTPNGCSSGWIEFQGHCYQLNSLNLLTWVDAERDCTNKGGHLASVHSKAENDFIHSLYSTHLFWLGGTDAITEVMYVLSKYFGQILFLHKYLCTVFTMKDPSK